MGTKHCIWLESRCPLSANSWAHWRACSALATWCDRRPLAEFTDLLVPAILTLWLLNSDHPDGVVSLA